jgi:hypothetical protein
MIDGSGGKAGNDFEHHLASKMSEFDYFEAGNLPLVIRI